jgi:DNA-directed RNA polymerase alpha subunit
MENKHLLEKPIEQFQTSKEFQEMCGKNMFSTLSDVVKFPVSELLGKPGFGMRILNELIIILEDNNLEEYLRD